MRLRFLLVSLSLAACSTARSDLRAEVSRSASELIGQRHLVLHGELLPQDCLALPRLAFGENGVELGANSPLGLYRRLEREGHVFSAGLPRRGDLVFTHDLSGAASLHVGVVGRVEADGTVTVYQRMAHGVEAYRMNTQRPHDGRDSQRTWNDSIASGDDTAPAGALFMAYASILP